MLSNEINYLDHLLSSLLSDFKAQITTLLNIQETEHKDLQRGYAYQKRGGASNISQQIMELRNLHKQEMDELKNRQVAII